MPIHRQLTSWLLLGLAAMALGSAAATTAAERVAIKDTITLRAGARFDSQMTFPAEVIDYTGRGLVVKMPGGNIQRYDTDEVLRVETTLSPAQQEADQLRSAGQYLQALDRYQEALQAESHPHRAWVRRQILAQMVRAYRDSGDRLRAAETFLALYKSDPTTFHFAVIPLEWMGRETPERLQRQAVAWSKDTDNPVAALIGASYLLTTSHRPEALKHLHNELSLIPDSRIHGLAKAQVWRTQVLIATRDDMEDWTREIERIPEPLRGGPYYVLGQAHARLGDLQQAALAYLWVPLVYDEDPELAGRACLEAARSLQRLGQQAEAYTLLQEVVDRFGQTEAAAEARSTLEQADADTPEDRILTWPQGIGMK